ncbi:site-specific integrase [Pseudoduganella namucuonensis]|uniref:Phage integrase family protein n=1 Tax=Pseudoduganella namucuonensis TaxID=1035707 RepID=A0A1I7M7F6_9BURK|nr:site-specific integrase [Pseudoduganella namucuonensis]SFV17827.1 Phage integrase family protein [Pseudoduganella namucuonensis]
MEPAVLASAQAMLRAVAAGISYDHIATAHGVAKSTVSVRVRRLAHTLQQIVGVLDVEEDASPSASLLRSHRHAYLEALEHFRPSAAPMLHRAPATLTPAQIDMLLMKIARHSHCPLRDQALLLVLFSTGAKPMEIAQLTVQDYLDAAGHVRRQSVLRAAIASNGADRPLPFDCAETISAIDAYLAERPGAEPGTQDAAGFRGLDPVSGLFLSRDGRPLQVRHTRGGQAACKEIHDIYRRIFSHGGLAGINTACARRMAALRMQAHGASTREIGDALGLKRPAVLRLLKCAAATQATMRRQQGMRARAP